VKGSINLRMEMLPGNDDALILERSGLRRAGPVLSPCDLFSNEGRASVSWAGPGDVVTTEGEQ